MSVFFKALPKAKNLSQYGKTLTLQSFLFLKIKALQVFRQMQQFDLENHENWKKLSFLLLSFSQKKNLSCVVHLQKCPFICIVNNVLPRAVGNDSLFCITTEIHLNVFQINDDFRDHIQSRLELVSVWKVNMKKTIVFHHICKFTKAYLLFVFSLQGQWFYKLFRGFSLNIELRKT